MRAILALAFAEVLHVVRDRATLAQVLLVPIIQLLVLSNAATFAIRDTPTYLVDHDRTTLSRDVASRFGASRHFRIVEQSTSASRAGDALLDGAVTLVVTIPRGFESAVVRTGVGTVQLALNAEKGTAAGIVQSYASLILDRFGRDVGAELRPQVRGSAPPLELRARSWFNPRYDYHYFMVPGILVALVTIISTLLSAQNVAREKELGTLEQLNVTPITRGQFITAKLLPFWVLGMLNLALGLVVGWLAFGVPVEGSFLLLFTAAGIYLVVAVGIGLVISTLVDTQQQAMFVAFFAMMIYLLMSGIFTPIDSMPVWVQPVTELNPVRHFTTIARSVMIRGAGLADVARPLLLLTAFAIGIVAFAVRHYAKRTG